VRTDTPYHLSALRARALYNPAYVDKYRREDHRAWQTGSIAAYAKAIHAEAAAMGRDAAILDLGCGTGRYFRCIRHAGLFVGLDASEYALAVARKSGRARLACGNVCIPCFRPGTFSLIYSIGVFEEHAPFDAGVARELYALLRPGGRLLLTVAHPCDVRKSWRRRLAEWVRDRSSGPLRAGLDRRLACSWYGLEPERVRRLLAEAGFSAITVRLVRGKVRTHTLATACRVS
jgi:SAM-dependent methyltransferase